MKHLKDYIKYGVIVLAFIASLGYAKADPNAWLTVKESLFPGKDIVAVDYIRVEAPERAFSGAQVPITLTYDYDKNPNIERIYIIVDENPVLVAATYDLTKALKGLKLRTNIRLERESYIHAVGEDSQGRLYMGYTISKAAGGCSGASSKDTPEVRAKAGQLSVEIKEPIMPNVPTDFILRVEHPMFSGLQKDLITGGYKSALFMQDVNIKLDGETLLLVHFGVGTSENPYLKFRFVPTQEHGTISVEAQDNEGKPFSLDSSF